MLLKRLVFLDNSFLSAKQLYRNSYCKSVTISKQYFSTIICTPSQQLKPACYNLQKILNNEKRNIILYVDQCKLRITSSVQCSTQATENAIKDSQQESVACNEAILSNNKNPNEVDPPQESVDIKAMFPLAKTVVNNAYQAVANDARNSKFGSVQFSYVPAREDSVVKWRCTATVHWPETKQFSVINAHKKLASNEVCWKILEWLWLDRKITKRGDPILAGKKEIDELKQDSLPMLRISTQSSDSLENILRLYYDRFLPSLTDEIKQEMSEDDSGLCYASQLQKTSQRINRARNPRSNETFLAKEDLQLPITQYKDKFISLLQNNRVIVLKGETGCGKSTRVPQYILEAWAREANFDSPCKIVVTQPRRIAAISLAERVAKERRESVGDVVGFQVRLKSQCDQVDGKILYCTTGILLRILQQDPELKGITHIVLDEAHERDVNTDLLMNLVRSTMETSPELKVIVMSATIDTVMFQKYFNNAPSLHVPGFTHPVTSYYLEDIDLNFCQTAAMCKSEYLSIQHEEVVRLIQYIHAYKPEGAILCFLPGWEDITKVQKLLPESAKYQVLCLHSRLDDTEQHNIFKRPPDGVRKIILATNIAETSVTINDVVYVVDTGIHKEGRFDNELGLRTIDNTWISKSSMIQRRGRAGRVQPGECYHMYSKRKSNEFSNYSVPEMLRASLAKIVLDAKAFSNNMNAAKFMLQLPSPPKLSAVGGAVDELIQLELLDQNENMTALGRTISDFQLEPRLSKALINAVVYKCVTPVVDIISLFSSDMEMFKTGLIDKSMVKKAKRQFSHNSDHLAMMRLFERWLNVLQTESEYSATYFARKNNVISHKFSTIEKLRKVHFQYLCDYLYPCMPLCDDYSKNEELVKAVILSGVGTLLVHYNWDVVRARIKSKNVFLTNNNHKAIITPSSVNFKRANFLSNLFLYINETRSEITRTTTIRETSMISLMSALLFSSKSLEVDSKYSSGAEYVRVRLKDTKVEVLCNKSHVNTIIQSKDAINHMYKYFVHHLVKGKDVDPQVDKIWRKVTANINNLLEHNRV